MIVGDDLLSYYREILEIVMSIIRVNYFEYINMRSRVEWNLLFRIFKV